MKDDEIEILDFDEEVIYTKKETVTKEVLIVEKNVDNIVQNNKKKKKRIGLGSKLFLFISVLFIIGCFVFYGYRTYYYYHKTHDVVKNISLKDKLTSLNNITYQNDGLYEKDGYFYYKGIDVNNYIYYSGRLFRIIDINKGIRIIEEDTETNLIWGVDSDYKDSTIHKWLEKYLNTLKDYDLYLEKNKWCNEKIDLENYDCNEYLEEYVGLLSTNDYLQAGAKNSYLNNETYFWTINQDKDGNSLYINNEGNINNLYKKDNNYFSYGIRPVITLKEDLSIISGDGSKHSPFIIEELGNALLKDNSIGSFVKYKNEDYRIISIDETGVSLIYNSILDVDKKYDDIMKYLNNEFIKTLNKEDLVKVNYDINEYSFNNKYELSEKNSKSNYATIPSIGDLFLNSIDGYWLNNYSDSKLGLYYIIDENKMFFADLKSNSHKVRPIIKLNIETVVSSGLGLKNDPLIIGEEGDTDVKEN